MNYVTLIGNLGNDPDIRETPNSKLCSFNLATSDGFGEHKKTNWHRVQVWGKQAEACAKFLAKGRLVAVTGSIDYSTYTDKEGVERSSVHIKAQSVEFLGGGESLAKPENKEPSNGAGRRGRRGQTDDIPVL